MRDQPAMAELVPQAEEDMAGIAKSVLFWTARDMTDLAVSAAASLPEWSPAAAIPEEFGLIAWATPVGTFDWPVPGSTERVRMPVDLMCWGVGDSSVGVELCVPHRADRRAPQPRPGPAAADVPPRRDVGPRGSGGPPPRRRRVSPMSVLGAAWLLSQQPSISERRQIHTATGQSTAENEAGADPDAVSIIELRRLRNPDGILTERDSGNGRRYDKRFWVSGHWRQQADPAESCSSHCGFRRTSRGRRMLRSPIRRGCMFGGDDDRMVDVDDSPEPTGVLCLGVRGPIHQHDPRSAG